MSLDYFQFKQFIVHHLYSTMKVGTDAVLLGTLSDLPIDGRILDVGTGTGVISLILAQRCKAQITAIDIHQASVWEARANFKESPWSDRLKALMIPYQLYAAQGNPIQYDLIISNPPFFENDLKSADKKRNMARHNDNLSFRDFLLASRNFISKKGELCLILPLTEGKLFIEEAKNFGFYLQKQIEIKPKPDKEANRLILSFGNQVMDKVQEKSITIRNSDNSYTETYKILTEDFYVSLK
ncbi:MAG: tRNA (adenosine(37)-N6)-methyltransferase TrmM [Bacteroidetes bacterium]|nr:MAG: tRNA (adenosine(37)-N6)-methyltransferase TrmM [Bacteroidota bacterium]